MNRVDFYSNVKDSVRNYLPLGFKQFVMGISTDCLKHILYRDEQKRL